MKYVDVSEGATTAYIRLDSVETAKEIIQKATPQRQMSLIAGNFYLKKKKNLLICKKIEINLLEKIVKITKLI